MILLTVPARCYLADVLKVLVGTKLSSQHNKSVVVDFQNVTSSEPAGSMLLLRWIGVLRDEGYSIESKFGEYCEDVRLETIKEHSKHCQWVYYSKVIGIFSGLGGAVPDFKKNAFAAGRYMPYQKLDLTEVRELRSHAGAKARNKCKLVSQELNEQFNINNAEIARSLKEIIENIVFHAGDKADCYVMSQLWTKTAALKKDGTDNQIIDYVNLTVYDNGCGLYATLKSKEGVDDDRSAIHQAVLPNITSTNGVDRGYGLAVLRAAAQTNKYSELFIGTGSTNSSGSAARFFRKPDGSGGVFDVGPFPLKGTFISLTFYPEEVNIKALDKTLQDNFLPKRSK